MHHTATMEASEWSAYIKMEVRIEVYGGAPKIMRVASMTGISEI